MRSRAPDPDEAVHAFGRRVAEVRLERGWTQEQLAERAEVSVRWVQHIEQGTQNLTIRSVAKLAGVLRVALPALFESPQTPKRGRGRPRAVASTTRRGRDASPGRRPSP